MRQITKFNSSDATEIYYSMHDCRRWDKVLGVDGRRIRKSVSHLTKTQRRSIYFAVMQKREHVLEGTYDDFTGEISNPDSETWKWANQLGRILARMFRAGWLPQEVKQ